MPVEFTKLLQGRRVPREETAQIFLFQAGSAEILLQNVSVSLIESAVVFSAVLCLQSGPLREAACPEVRIHAALVVVLLILRETSSMCSRLKEIGITPCHSESVRHPVMCPCCQSTTLQELHVTLLCPVCVCLITAVLSIDP